LHVNATEQLNLEILRPDDLLVLSVQAVNLRLDTSAADQPRLVRNIPGEAAYLVYVFPPQSIAEQAFFETAQVTQQPSFNTPPGPPQPPTTADPLAAPGGVAAWVAGESRLVFRLPSGMAEIEFSMSGLLDWAQLEPVFPAAAQVMPGASSGPSGTPPITAPGSLETSLELPYRLMMSPNVMQGVEPGWEHAAVPVLHGGRAELWHTRLGQVKRTGGGIEFTEASPASPVPLRAVWSPDFVADGPLPVPDPTPPAPRTAMDVSDRDQIVILTSGFSGYTLTDTSGARPYVPVPVDASRVFLSALGGWLTSRGAWPFPVSYRVWPVRRPVRPIVEPAPTADLSVAADRASIVVGPEVVGLDLIEWDHLATQGRDHHVKIVYEGFAYPTGHRLTLVKVSERKVLAPNGESGNPADSPVAYLRQRMYIVPREHDKSYLDAPYTHQGREMPLASLLRINTKVTPDLDPPPNGVNRFWINVGGQPFQFHMTARDLAGQEFSFLAPLIFVSLSASAADLDAVATDYVADAERRRSAVAGQKVAYADPAAGHTALKTRAFYFTAQPTGEQAPYVVAPFIPVLDNAEVTVPSLPEILGQQTAVLIKLYAPYLASGLDPNAGVFAEIDGTQPGVSFSADRSGGFAQPNIVLTALSARKGLVSGAASDAAQGKINPGAYFGPTDAKLFGTVPIGDLIPVDAQSLASAADNAPTIRTEAKPNATHPKELVTVLTWHPQLKDFDGRLKPTPIPVQVLFNTGGTSALKLQVKIQNDLSGKPPTSEATGELTNFTLQLFDVVGIAIASIKFTSKDGAKSLVALDLAKNNPIGFDGPLQFVQTLADILPPGLFGGKGPSIKPTSNELKVSYTLGLPPMTCGVFSLEHIAIMAGLDLPYLDGKPAVEFGFASRSKPFLLTVEIFGGGGFVHLIVGADGVQMVEGALEFGGNFAFDIGVASGGVHAMAGIYFQLKGTKSDLTGFVDIGGEVSVLGIISISLDLNISLSWEHSDKGDLIEGRATMTVSVHVLFFSADVQLSVERSFSAGGGDPRVAQLVTVHQWSEYAGAFA
jgi:hypothetical protein